MELKKQPVFSIGDELIVVLKKSFDGMLYESIQHIYIGGIRVDKIRGNHSFSYWLLTEFPNEIHLGEELKPLPWAEENWLIQFDRPVT